MAHNRAFCEIAQICSGFVPVNLATAANNGDWVNMQYYHKLVVVFFKGAGTAGDDPTLTLLQAMSNSGGSSKALNFTKIWVKQGTLTSVTQYTLTTQSAANTYTDATSAEVEAIWVVEIDAADLDTANGFKFVQASVADVGSNAQIGALLYLGIDSRYEGSSLQSMLS